MKPGAARAERQRFLGKLDESLRLGSFVKLTLSRPANPAEGPRNLYARPILLRGRRMLSLTSRFANRDESANCLLEEARTALADRIGPEFLRADLFTLTESVRLLAGRRGRVTLRFGPARHRTAPATQHDAVKRRMLPPEGRPYLQAMGLADAGGNILPGGRKKYRQVDRYIELLDGLLRRHPLPHDAHVVDVGSGSGALTFALYDHLRNGLGLLRPSVTGIEQRAELAASCNELARTCGFEGLAFVSRDIHAHPPARVDMLVALHACDTATDMALALGVRANASILVAAPCCHKQVRRDMTPPPGRQSLLRHGILAERAAEILTDGLRALLLEARGYPADVFEFIAPGHTSKNVMIAAVRGRPRPAAAAEARALMRDFGIRRHALDDLLRGGTPHGAGPGGESGARK